MNHWVINWLAFLVSIQEALVDCIISLSNLPESLNSTSKVEQKVGQWAAVSNQYPSMKNMLFFCKLLHVKVICLVMKHCINLLSLIPGATADDIVNLFYRRQCWLYESAWNNSKWTNSVSNRGSNNLSSHSHFLNSISHYSQFYFSPEFYCTSLSSLFSHFIILLCSFYLCHFIVILISFYSSSFIFYRYHPWLKVKIFLGNCKQTMTMNVPPAIVAVWFVKLRQFFLPFSMSLN